MNENRKRRWLQFSLRGLLFLMVMIAVPLGWVAYKVRRQRQLQQISEIETVLQEKGWHVQYTHDRTGASTILKQLQRFWGEEDGPKLTIAFPLRWEDCVKVTVYQISDIGALTHLKDLGLIHTKVTDAGLVNIERLTNLESLSLFNTQVTDNGLVHVEGLTQLRELDLGYTKVTDAGLSHLEGLAQLRSLDLSGTQVTNAGVQKLKKILPRCEIWK